jgi:hypothetical protein
MKFQARPLPKATPEMAKRVWARHQRPSARRVARAMGLAGYPVHWVTVARWRAHDWKAGPSDHPLEVARAQLEAVAPLITGDPETTLDDLIGDPEQEEIRHSGDYEVLRDAGRAGARQPNDCSQKGRFIDSRDFAGLMSLPNSRR